MKWSFLVGPSGVWFHWCCLVFLLFNVIIFARKVFSSKQIILVQSSSCAALTFIVLSEGYLYFPEHYTVWPRRKFAGTPTAEEQHFPLAKHLSHCRTLTYEPFEGDFISWLMSNDCYFSKSIADVSPSWHYAIKHLKAPASNATAKTSVFIEVCTSADRQFIKAWWSTTDPSNPLEGGT